MTTNRITPDKGGIAIVLVSGNAMILLTAQESSIPASGLIPIVTNPVVEILDEQPVASFAAADKYSSYITQENLVQNNFVPGERFFYTLTEFDNFEFGIAEVKTSGTRFLLDRQRVGYYFDGESRSFTAQPRSYSEPRLFLQVSSPEFLEETLFFGNSVPCMSASGALSSIVLDNNTVLGCKDNQIQAINSQEFSEIFQDGVLSAIDNQSVNLQSTRLMPRTRPVNPVRGTIIYNDQFNQIEFYNGTMWVPL